MQEVAETWNTELGAEHTETQRWVVTLARWKAATPLKPGAAQAAALAQLGHSSLVVGVCVEGLISLPDYNDVYFPVDESRHQGWPRFVSAGGKHLFRAVERELWMLRYVI